MLIKHLVQLLLDSLAVAVAFNEFAGVVVAAGEVAVNHAFPEPTLFFHNIASQLHPYTLTSSMSTHFNSAVAARS